ncbi:MAG: lantibiotic dehydratase, partial [Bacteroidota bacterium]
EKEEHIRKFWKNALATLIDKQASCIALRLENIQLIASLNPIEQKTEKASSCSLGCLLQFWGQEENQQVFVDTCFPGYGKMLGRFLPLFSETCTEQIRVWNEQMQGKDLFVELLDASYFNANVHPPLLQYEMQMPGSQNNLPEAQRIKLEDLTVRVNPDTASLQLFHEPSQKRVFLFDFGFEALANRSPLYRFMAHFSKPTTNFSALCDLINEIVCPDNTADLIHHPSIRLEDRLYLQRERWYFHQSGIPRLGKGETDAAFFLRINQWRKEQQLPQHVFYSLNPKDIDLSGLKEQDRPKSKKEDYKPQYLDFNHPLAVQVFAKGLSRVPLYLKIEEMLPSPKDGIAVNDENFVNEVVVQWERRREQ